MTNSWILGLIAGLFLGAGLMSRIDYRHNYQKGYEASCDRENEAIYKEAYNAGLESAGIAPLSSGAPIPSQHR